jgi:hypothetical protein
MTTTLTEKILAQSPTETLSLLYVIGAIGQRNHQLVLIRREGKTVVEAMDYSPAMTDAIAAEMGATQRWSDMAPDVPQRQVRATTMGSSSGDALVSLIAEKVSLKRTPDGNWAIELAAQPTASTNPNTTPDAHVLESKRIGPAGSAITTACTRNYAIV